MASVYEDLIDELRSKLKKKNIDFVTMVNLINSQAYDKIIELVRDETIFTLITKIITERERIGNAMEKNLNDLLWLNEMLIIFSEQPQPSKTQALKVLKTKVFINIYDFEAKKYERRTTKQKLKAQLRKHPEKRYLLQDAKNLIEVRLSLFYFLSLLYLMIKKDSLIKF